MAIQKSVQGAEMDKKVVTVVAVINTVALLNYFEKVLEDENLKIILTVVCALTKIQ